MWPIYDFDTLSRERKERDCERKKPTTEKYNGKARISLSFKWISLNRMRRIRLANGLYNCVWVCGNVDRRASIFSSLFFVCIDSNECHTDAAQRCVDWRESAGTNTKYAFIENSEFVQWLAASPPYTGKLCVGTNLSLYFSGGAMGHLTRNLLRKVIENIIQYSCFIITMALLCRTQSVLHGR